MKLRLTVIASTIAMLAACGGGGSGDSALDAPPQNSLAQDSYSVSLIASSASLRLGQTAALSWRAPGASSCAASGAWHGSRAAEGSLDVHPITVGQHTFTLTCDGVSRSVTLAVTARDIAALGESDITPLLSMAGEWKPIDKADTAVIFFYGTPRIGPDQREGVLLAGWAYNGFDNKSTDITPVRVALLEQNDDGTLRDGTARLLPSALTNGAGSVVWSDFNGDGRDDIFLAAHNESPFMLKSSTAYLSRPDGIFARVDVGDAVMAHHATLGTWNGAPAVVMASFGTESVVTPVDPVGAFIAAYTFDGGLGFTQNWRSNDVGAMSIATGDFLGKGYEQVILGGFTEAHQINPVSNDETMRVVMFDRNGDALASVWSRLPGPYFNGKPQYASVPSYWDPKSKSHQSRLWSDDLNQDGVLDLVVGTEIWPGWRSMLQLLVNEGDGRFVDRTDDWAMPWNEKGAYDYSLRAVDLDGSGIKTWLAAQMASHCQTTPCPPDDHGNYVLVNDGTGQFHRAMHEQFTAIGVQVSRWLNRRLEGTAYVMGSEQPTPRMIPYRNGAGRLNFLAVYALGVPEGSKWREAWVMVNVPLAIDLETEYRKDITIADRRGSRNIRTFAGNDTIHGGCGAGTCRVDGGYGVNTIVYAGARGDYVIEKTADGYRVAHGAGAVDLVRRIQLLKFADVTVDLRQGL